MVPRALAGLMMVTAAVAGGCFGEPEDGTDPTPTGPAGGNQTAVLTLTIDNFTANTTAGGMINVTWTVESEANGTIEIPHTAIHWANFSVPSVNNTTGPDVYGNNSGVTAGQVPGTFNASFTVEEPGTIYLRAHAIHEDENYWSDEVQVDVVNGTPPLGTVHTIEIGTLTPGPFSNYDPAELTIAVGDAIVWSNEDPLMLPHTATAQPGAPEAFDTGNIGAGAESVGIQFLTPGTYEYYCAVHGEDSMSAQFTVE